MRRRAALVTLLAVLSIVPRPAGAWEGFRLDRIAGQTRYGTAAAIALDAFPDGSASAVVASGEGFADALAGAQLGLPILLTERDEVPRVTKTALDDLGVETIYLLGGSAAIEDEVVRQLDDREIVRLAGDDRYGTAAAASERAQRTTDVALLASGEAFPDALAAGATAGAAGLPLLLTRHGALPPATVAALDALQVGRVLVVGGPAAISDAVTEQLVAEGLDVQRIAGADREATAAQLASVAIEELGLDPAIVLLASSRDYPDALAAAGAASAVGAPLLVAGGDRLSPSVVDHFDAHSTDVLFGRVYGGTAVFSAALFDDALFWGRDTFPHYWATLTPSSPITTGTTPEVIRLANGTERLFVTGERTTAWDTLDGKTFTEVGVDVPAGLDPSIVPTSTGWRMYLLDGNDVVSATSTDASTWTMEGGVRFTAPMIEDLEAVVAHDGVRLLFSDGAGTRGAVSADQGTTFTADTWYLPDLTAPAIVQLANGWYSGTFERVEDGQITLTKANSYDGRVWDENFVLIDFLQQVGDNQNPTTLPIDAANLWLYWAAPDGDGGFAIHRARFGPGDG